ncbi:MAG: carbon-nitrogen hydrolase family protein, partial [Candidatus Cybelea sp.]
AVQLRAHDRDDFPLTLDRIIEAASEAALHADLVVLPESTFPAYVLGGARLVEEAAIAGAIQRLREVALATHTVIVAGAAASTDTGLRNGAFVIDSDGSLAGRADKLFLWHFDRRWFAPGERIEPVTTAIGVLGVLVCADGRLPTIARALVDRGASALVMPTAWVTSGRNPAALENVQADLLARVRAYENGVPFIAANKCGTELGMVAYCGKSQIVDSRGEIVALAGEREPQTLVASIALRSALPRRTALGEVKARRSELGRTLRLAISFDPLPDDIDERIELLEVVCALSPDDGERLATLDRILPVASVGDELVLDPAGLVSFSRAGYSLVCWTTEIGAPWTERIARARALELRLYVVVFDRSRRRAFAVDPDGAIVAGTFDQYRLASFSLDPRKTAETTVAPGSDVREGLERIARILDDNPR